MTTTQLIPTEVNLSQYRDLFNYEAPFLEEKLFKEGKVKSKEEYDEAFAELKKYFFLRTVYFKTLQQKGSPQMSLEEDFAVHAEGEIEIYEYRKTIL